MNSSTFFDKSKEIANDYIQSVVFLDDKAYRDSDKESTDHDFDILKISKAFAKENKICAAYRPESEKDINDFKIIANKADVVVLDWQIEFPQVVEQGLEEQDEPDEPRGAYTKQIIQSVIFDNDKPKDSLKLILVYTGDYTYLESITEDIYKNVFKSSQDYKYDSENHTIQSHQVKVVIRSKPAEIAFDANKDKYEKHMVHYEKLPAFVLTEFTLMTSGLLSNFALLSLSALRKNSTKILSLFSKELDNAYLSHKSLLPSQEDAEDLLIELFGDTISDLLLYNKSNEELRNLINDWIQDNINEENKELLKKDGAKYSPTETFTRTHQILIDLLNSTNKDVEKRYIEIFNSKAGISKTKINDYFKYISLNNTLLFLNSSKEFKKSEIDQKFSILTHHKSLFIPNNTIPKLTLGTIIRSTKNSDNYYICIQQKCDSVRISKNVERKFLFIPLVISDSKFDILTPDGIKLKKVKDSFSIRTIKFVCKDDKGIIKAEQDDKGAFIFKQKYEDEHFEWILDLKDLHSQRIIIEYTSQLSRVGLDESEWHRRYLS
ncbi:hypothetical protein EB1_24740 [Empedobacter brevis NBRC 14943 = ATCC 43319]|uniref:Response receiver domain-containing protein n=1 Tax=Empedobacter brevis NBRC 14943 = ATCC 43319 TaxID=1218108 RepID=A0A511NIT7_9FLAO|nr:response regulator receiver domain [Empedobacter brevis]GEM52684.1 hypothetical protein EB1_24740 [Empedobacter brevis NBRC 14943 = ATCC 43319]